MTTIIKNQILKHLTKFTKNLSPEKIKINAFKGEGDVSNLEFDEEKLTELLELPNWIKIKRAACNKVAIKVQWTLIKKQPIILILDEIFLVVEALQTPRQPKVFSNSVPSYRSNTGSYGFSDRVIDGIKVKINMVKIIFSSTMFKANIELMRVVVSSKMPNWEEADHLKKTRLKSSSTSSSYYGDSRSTNASPAGNAQQHSYNSTNTTPSSGGNVPGGAVLLFKEIEWDSTRIEANALGNIQATPVKLITNTIKIRLIIKKSLSNCSILDSKVEFILNDLFWVLTISQIKAAILFSESLMGLIRLSNEMNKEAAKQRLENSSRLTVPISSTSSSHLPQNYSSPSINSTSNNWSNNIPQVHTISNRQKLFNKYDLKETSYHVLVARIEFHFCEEGEQGVGMSPNSVLNGSIKLLFINSQIDLYPYHISAMTRDHFSNYKEIKCARDNWLKEILPTKTNTSSNTTTIVHDTHRQLMESVTIVRFHDIRMHTVATSSSNNKKSSGRLSQPLLGSDIYRHRLPSRTCTFVLDMTNHYWSSSGTNNGGTINRDLPDTTIFCQIKPIFFMVDWETLIWLNAFYLNLDRELKNLNRRLSEKEINLEELMKNKKTKKVQQTRNSTAIHLEAIMTRVILLPDDNLYDTSTSKSQNPLLRPNSIHILIGAISIDNVLLTSGHEPLLDLVREQESNYTNWNKRGQKKFPFTDGDYSPNRTKTEDTDSDEDSNINFMGFYHELIENRRQRRIWSIQCQPIWLEFEGLPGYQYGYSNINSSGGATSSQRGITRPFIEPINVHLLIMMRSVVAKQLNTRKSPLPSSNENQVLLCRVSKNQSASINNENVTNKTAVDLSLDHYQLMVLYRVIDTVTDGSSRLTQDKLAISNLSIPTNTINGIDNPIIQDRTILLVNIPDMSLSLKWLSASPEELLEFHSNDSQETQSVGNNNLNNQTNGSYELGIHNDGGVSTMYDGGDNTIRCMTPQSTRHNRGPQNNSDIDGIRQISTTPTTPSNIPSNRRSYTSLSTIELDNTVNNQTANYSINLPNNLINCQSARNLLSSSNLTLGLRSNRKNSSSDLASLKSGGGDMSEVGSDASDDEWINNNTFLMMDNRTTPLPPASDEGSTTGAILFNVATNNESSPSCLLDNTQSLDIIVSDIRIVIDSCSMGTAIALGIFHDIRIGETNSNREADQYFVSCLNSSVSDDDPIVCMRIGALSPMPDMISNTETNPISQVDIDIRIMNPMTVSLQMSSLVALADLLEDEISFNLKYPPPNTLSPGKPLILPPKIKLELNSPIQLDLIEDRVCTNQNTTCPGEHANTRVLVPTGVFVTMDGASLFTINVGFHINEPLIQQQIPVNNRHRGRSTGSNNSTNTVINFNENNSPGSMKNHSLEAGSPVVVDHPIKTELSKQKSENELDSIGSYRNARKLREVSKLYRQSQDEVEKLRIQLERVTRERDDLLNLVNSPQTHLL